MTPAKLREKWNLPKQINGCNILAVHEFENNIKGKKPMVIIEYHGIPDDDPAGPEQVIRQIMKENGYQPSGESGCLLPDQIRDIEFEPMKEGKPYKENKSADKKEFAAIKKHATKKVGK